MLLRRLGTGSRPVDMSTERPSDDSREQLGRERCKNEFTHEGSMGGEEVEALSVD